MDPNSYSQEPFVKHSRRGHSWISWLFAALCILVIGGVIVLVRSSDQTPNLADVIENVYIPSVVSASSFATYKETPVNITPRVPAYTVSPNLENVSNAADFTMSEAAKKLLVKNGFVVVAGRSPEFFPVYESNRYSYVPNFVTTDSILHNYHLMFDYTLKKLEEEKFALELQNLSKGMLEDAITTYNSVKGSEWENAARRNVAFFTVGSLLQNKGTVVPDFVKDEVNQEMTLIDTHAGIALSPVINLGSQPNALEGFKEDYSQYIARGHYDRSEELKAYFKAMMWYGRLTFRLKVEDEIKSAALMTYTLSQHDNQQHWDAIYEPINFFVGKSDDITFYKLKAVMDQVYGQNLSLPILASDTSKFASFVEETKKLDPPQINSIPIFNSELQPDREKEIKGFRFMGQRFTVDASIFQRLVDREVEGRMLPKGLDIPAALGSKEATNILSDLGETKYKNYSTNMSKLQTYMKGLSEAYWTQNLYWGWLHTLRPLTEEKGEGYPSFMRNAAWTRKQLNAFLGSWTELKHDTILYAKQVYAELGGGPPEKKDDRGYVEPNPYVYARLASLLQMTQEGLESRKLVSDTMKENLQRMQDLALALKTISEKELNNEPLTETEYELIRSYGGQLEHFWLEVNKDEPEFSQYPDQQNYLNDNPAALVADVATDPNGQVLEEATGYIADIFVVVPIDGKLRLTKGGVYSYYEFPWPLSDRLTDQRWREELLNSSPAPAFPTWTNQFLVSE